MLLAMRKSFPNDGIGDGENTLTFPGKENCLGFRPRPSFPIGQGTIPAPGLQTLLSPTQYDHSIPQTEWSVITKIKIPAIGGGRAHPGRFSIYE